MSATPETSSAPKSALLASQEQQSLNTYLRGYLQRIRSGDIGSLPIIIGLLVICVIFQTQNANFLTPHNFVNLIVQMAGYTAVAYGLVFILLLGEIDLSVAYVSAVAGVIMTLLLNPPASLPWYLAIAVALLISAAIGFLHGAIITFFQVPSFVVTLAGLLAWNGVVLIIVGDSGTVIIQDKVVKGLTTAFLPPALAWAIVAVFIVIYAATQYLQIRSRKQAGLRTRPMVIVVAQVIFLAAISAFAVFVANQDTQNGVQRGVPVIAIVLVVLLFFLTYVAERTRFGRYVYAIGGNKEATRRAGVKVERIRVYVFMIASTMAGVGGVILASRAQSVATNQGGGNLLLNCIAAAVIGGTSLFGGRGKVYSAVLGALIIASVENGMGLLDLSAGIQFIVTGLVLLAAVIVDALSRRTQKQSGLA